MTRIVRYYFSFISLSIFILPLCAQESDSSDVKYTTVEEMPIFGECNDQLKGKALNQCSNSNVHTYLSKNLKYPKKAKKKKIEGVVYVSFVIDKDGSVIDVQVVKGVKDGELLDEEAVRVISEMPRWIPGKQRGKTVKVQYYIPIRFRI